MMKPSKRYHRLVKECRKHATAYNKAEKISILESKKRKGAKS